MAAPQLNVRARAHLRSLAHGLNPVVQVGGQGITEAIIKATKEALLEHELIKVRLGQSYEGDRKEGGRELADATEADLTQVIGRVVVLYRPRPADHPKNETKPPIQLPKRGSPRK